MNFIRRIGRDEIYIKYVHQLVNVGKSLHVVVIQAYSVIVDASPKSELR